MRAAGLDRGLARTRRSDRRRLGQTAPARASLRRRALRRAPRRRGAARRARRRGRRARRTRRRAASCAADRRPRRGTRMTPSPVAGRDRDRTGVTDDASLHVVAIGAVGLRPHEQHGHAHPRRSRAARVSTASMRSVGFGRRRVDEVHEQIRVRDLVERRAERFDELVRQAAHEADRVGEQHRLAARKVQAAGRRVERREQLVLDEHARVREPVEQRRLARVRVADERDSEQLAPAAGLALRRRASPRAARGRARASAPGAAAGAGRSRAASHPGPGECRCRRPAG